MSADKSNAGPEMTSNKEAGETNSPARKPYHPPKLTIYGSIQKLTNTTSKGTKFDGGMSPKNMRTCL